MYAEGYDVGLDADGVDEAYFEGYGDVRVHGTMLRDTPRMVAYAKAIEESAHIKGKRVIDVGAGSGILSLLAARAGAAKVYAVEASPVAELLREVVRGNGMEGKVEVLQRRVEDLTPEDLGGEKVDIVVSEWMGFFLLHESMLPSVLHARDTLLQPAGEKGKVMPWQMLPYSASISLAPVAMDGYLEEHVAMWTKPILGFDLSAFHSSAQEAVASEPLIEVVPSGAMLATPKIVAEFDLTTIDPSALETIAVRPQSFTTTAKVHAFAVWFDTSFATAMGDVVLSTSPSAPPTHWKQTVIFLPPHGHVEGSFSVAVNLERQADNPRCYSISLEIPDAVAAMLLDAMKGDS